MGRRSTTESVVREIRSKTRKKYSAEEKIRIVLEGMRGKESIATICRKEEGSTLICITDGTRIFWKPEKSDFWAILSEELATKKSLS